MVSCFSFPLAVNLLGGTDLSPDAHIALLARVGWDGFFTGWQSELTAAYAAAGRAHDLLYSSIHAPFGGARVLWELDETEAAHEAARREVETLLACVRDCAANEVPVMVIHPFIGFEDHTVTEAGLRNFGAVIDEADRLGVLLAFENVEGEEYLAAIMNRFAGRPSVRFCLDTGHELCYNRGKDMLSLYGQSLGYTHFNDNVGVTGDAVTWLDDLHLVMGDGIVDFPHVMARIEKTPYRGPLACEMSRSNKPGGHTHDGYAAMEIEDFYRLCLERMRQITGRNGAKQEIYNERKDV